ncbi:MAG TPA: alpha-L-fucosidase [Planctomycetota bacterium]
MSYLLFLVTIFSAVVPALTIHAADTFLPDGKLKPDDFAVLHAHDAKFTGDLRRGPSGQHGKFPVKNWRRAEQMLSWDIDVPEEDVYAVNVLVFRGNGQQIEAKVACAGQQVLAALPAGERFWSRYALDGTLTLPKGKQTVTLQARSLTAAPEFQAEVMAVELVRPAVRDHLHEAALKQRSDTTWMQQARFGIMSHWTSQSVPRNGPPKPYVQAAQDFDVEKLADQIKETGAGFFLMTTSHGELYFPAPIKALDKILPGRTAQRDLVADLAGALNKRGIKLMLYYHIGATSDPAWLKASGFWDTDTTRIFANWQAIIGEIGERYGSTLAGWWFDDGSINYYYRSAPWEQLTRAAKAGFPQRVVGYNPWVLPSATEFQDYWCGEDNLDASVRGLLPAGGDGHLTGGSHKGQQACATVITEGDWVHTRRDSAVGKPRWNAEQLAALLKSFIERKNVPIFNLEIYQEGTLSTGTIEVFKEASGKVGK